MKRTIAMSLELVLLLFHAPTLGAQAAAFRVVVHASNTVTELSKAELARIFLKKTTTWADGKPALPVDLGPQSPVRRGFSQRVLQRDVAAAKTYWQQMIFSGRAVPPPEKPSEAEVLAFVRTNPGAVGYVSADAALGDGLKHVTVKE